MNIKKKGNSTSFTRRGALSYPQTTRRRKVNYTAKAVGNGLAAIPQQMLNEAFFLFLVFFFYKEGSHVTHPI